MFSVTVVLTHHCNANYLHNVELPVLP